MFVRRVSLYTFLCSGMLYLGLGAQAVAETLDIGQAAPDFELTNQDGKPFKLSTRKGKAWTILYFYPKADSPGCREQACAFRDTIKKIQAKNADIFGISTDNREDQKAFHEKHSLVFDLLSDGDKKVSAAYGVKRPLVGVAKRWTFILDKDLVIRNIEPDVDPAFDAQWTVETLDELQNPPKAATDK